MNKKNNDPKALKNINSKPAAPKPVKLSKGGSVNKDKKC